MRQVDPLFLTRVSELDVLLGEQCVGGICVLEVTPAGFHKLGGLPGEKEFCVLTRGGGVTVRRST